MKKILKYTENFEQHLSEYKTHDISKSKTSSNIEPLTIREFSSIRDAMYAVRTTNSPSANQSKEFFKNEENFEIVIEKLRKLLLYRGFSEKLI
jgi:hypothetical protein